MTSRIPLEWTQVSPNVWRDANLKVTGRLVSADNDIQGPAPIDGNTINTHRRRRVEVQINGTTNLGREIGICTISLGVCYAAVEPNSTTETFQVDPIITPEGKTVIPLTDLKDTILDILDGFNYVAPFID